MGNSTERRTRRLDVKLPDTGGGAIIAGGGGAPPAPPAVPVPGAPRGLRITATFLLYSAVTPQAGLTAAWSVPVGSQEPDGYTVQWSTSAGFASPTTRAAARGQLTITLDGMPTNTTIYVRVAARVAGLEGAWSATASATTPQDTTAPAAPTSLATSWNGATGDLRITWVNPTSPNLRDVRVRVYASNGGALLTEDYSASGAYTWTRAQNLIATSGTPDTSVYLVLTARSWGNVLSATDLTGTATLAPPATPAGLTHTWVSDTGTAGPNMRAAWTRNDAVAYYRLSIDGVTTGRDRIVAGGYDYPLALNAAEHSGTPDPVLSLSLVAYDALGQASSAATATATNAAPPATTISAFGAFDKVGLTIGASAAQDIKDYRVRVYLEAVLVDTIYVTDTTPVYVAGDGDGDYTFDVTPRDLFGQLGTASAQTVAQSLTDPGKFVEDLRAGVVYRDSLNTDPATLAGLKDGNTAASVVTYTSSTPWRWTEAIRAFVDRHRKANLATSASASYYYGVSVDGVTWSWYAGGTATGGVWSPVAQASEAAAQAAATTLAAGVWLITLPANVEARYFRLGHRNTSASYALRELYPRGLIEVDDLRIETLAGITANLGTVVAGEMTGVTITGGTVQTAASGARVELTSAGLKTFNAAGQVVIEATTATDGALKAGVGVVTLDRDGIRVAAATGATPVIERGYNFVSSLATPPDYYGVYGYNFFDRNALLIGIDGTDASPPSLVNIIAAGMDDGGTRSVVSISASTPTDDAAIRIEPEVNISLYGAGVDITAGGPSSTARADGSLWVAGSATIGYGNGGLNVGDATGADDGEIRATRTTAATTSSDSLGIFAHRSSGTPGVGFGGNFTFRLESTSTNDRDAAFLIWRWAVATDASRRGQIELWAADATTNRNGLTVGTTGSAPSIGFLGASPVARPTVTGSRGGNAALASLLTALDTLGLITNSSS